MIYLSISITFPLLKLLVINKVDSVTIHWIFVNMHSAVPSFYRTIRKQNMSFDYKNYAVK